MKRLLLIAYVLVGFASFAQGPIVQFCSPVEATLPRPPGSVDPDAEAFFTAANISNSTQRSAVNQLVLDLKAAGVWVKIRVLFPFVGGTAQSHSVNLVNPSLYGITWYGGVAHSANGVKFDASGSYATTNFQPLVSLANNSISMGFYSRTPNDAFSVNVCFATTDYQGAYLATNWYGGDQYTSATGYFYAYMGDYAYPNALNTAGFFHAAKNPNGIDVYRNEALLQSLTSSAVINSGDFLAMGAYLVNGTPQYGFSSSELGLVFVSESLTSSESAAMNTYVQDFEQTLGRRVL